MNNAHVFASRYNTKSLFYVCSCVLAFLFLLQDEADILDFSLIWIRRTVSTHHCIHLLIAQVHTHVCTCVSTVSIMLVECTSVLLKCSSFLVVEMFSHTQINWQIDGRKHHGLVLWKQSLFLSVLTLFVFVFHVLCSIAYFINLIVRNPWACMQMKNLYLDWEWKEVLGSSVPNHTALLFSIDFKTSVLIHWHCVLTFDSKLYLWFSVCPLSVRYYVSQTFLLKSSCPI